MNIQEILKLLGIKYPDCVLLIYDDESGRITSKMLEPYLPSNEPEFSFTNLDELLAHLRNENVS